VRGPSHRGLAHLDIGSDKHGPWSWATSVQTLDEAVVVLAAPDDIATISSRTQIINFDKQIATGCDQIDAGPGVQDLPMLQTLLRSAEKNDDHQLQHGVQWRIDVHIHNKQPNGLAISTGLVLLRT
jgi:hypothetical protein